MARAQWARDREVVGRGQIILGFVSIYGKLEAAEKFKIEGCDPEKEADSALLAPLYSPHGSTAEE